jgi:hypothetical protein
MSDASPEALDRLSKMVLHPFPRIRSAAVDTLYVLHIHGRELAPSPSLLFDGVCTRLTYFCRFVTTGYGKGVDWLKAGKGDLAKLREQLGIPVR